jgi:ABC-type transport system involved in cytochrome bd biosynthesis fused ATPase/permease subunit
VRLSGGQAQRVALARALAAGADLLLALDARTELELWDARRNLGVTVLGASSKRATLARADRVVVLHGGRVVVAGAWTDLADR